MPNFVKIGQSVVKLSRCFRFFKMVAAAILGCRPCNPGFQCETQKICRTRSDGHFLRVQPKIEFPKFGEKLVQEVEVSIDIAMHNKNVVDIYDYMPPYFGCEYFV